MRRKQDEKANREAAKLAKKAEKEAKLKSLEEGDDMDGEDMDDEEMDGSMRQSGKKSS